MHEMFTSDRPKAVILETCGGLGDHLKFTTFPEILSGMGYDVYMHEKCYYRNDGIKQLIDRNPFIKGYISMNYANIGYHVLNHDHVSMPELGNYVSKIEHCYFGKVFNKYPKIYYTPKTLERYKDVIYADLTSISAREPQEVLLDYAKEKYGEVEIAAPKSIFEYIDIIHSCKMFLCAHSGGMNLASAINRRNTVCLMTDKVFEHYVGEKMTGNWVFDNIKYESVTGKVFQENAIIA